MSVTNILSNLPRFLHSQFFITPTIPKTADCTGKTVIITGANTGLGKEAVRHYVQLNAKRVILACRTASKGQAAKDDIEASTQRKGVIEVWELDYSDLQSVRNFAERTKKDLDRIDIVIENAGISTSKFVKVGDYESTVLVNIVSTFLLALLLVPVLQETSKRWNFTPTLTIVASEVHFFAAFKERKYDNIFAALNDEKTSTMFDRYNVSKLIEILVVREVTAHHPVSETNVTINTVNPGFCHSELTREVDGFAVRLFKRILARTTEIGARTLVVAGLSGPNTHGEYMSDAIVAPTATLVTSQEGKALQVKLWGELKDELERLQPGVTKSLA